jgi:hypothetical protein
MHRAAFFLMKRQSADKDEAATAAMALVADGVRQLTPSAF